MNQEQEILEEIEHCKSLLVIAKRHLRIEQRKAATYGLDLPAYIQINIEDRTKEITDNEARIQQLRHDLQRLQAHSGRANQPLDNYLQQIAQRYRYLRLPLLNLRGQFIALPLEQIRIDLPLRLTLDHKILKLDDIFSDVEHIEWVGREIFTSSMLHDKQRSIVDAAQHERLYSIGERLDQAPRMVIVGDPGCGKTTLLASVAYRYAVEALPPNQRASFPSIPEQADTLPDRPWVPVVLTCRELLDTRFDVDLQHLITYQLGNQHYSNEETGRLSTVLCSMLQNGQAILLVDGLDEIPDEEQRQQFASLLARYAERWSDMPIMVTARVAGFRVVRETLSTSFDHLNVAPLGVQEKEQFLRTLTTHLYKGDQQAIIHELRPQICYSRQLARLSENVFLLALIIQMRLLGEQLPTRRPDIYRKAVELMIERQRRGKGSKLTINEVLPHLEYIAYKMRVAGEQRWSETTVLAAVEELRAQEPHESALHQRSAQEWLDAVIHRLGILNIAGPGEIDEYGYERRIIQFFHQSFQEYFAAEALRHRRGIQDGAGILELLRSKIHNISITQRRIETLGLGRHTEPVVAGNWQEVVRFCIAELGTQERTPSADDAIRMILPTSRTLQDEARALTVFALQCLAEEPSVQADTLYAIADAVTGIVTARDGMSRTQHTLLDEALSAVVRSRYGQVIQDHLLHAFVYWRESRRMHIGRLLMLAVQSDTSLTHEEISDLVLLRLAKIRNGNTFERVRAALDLCELFYSPYATNEIATPTRGNLALQREIVSTLVSAIEVDTASNGAVSAACIWALVWFSNTKSATPHPACDVVLAERARLMNIISNPNLDETFRSYVALICSHVSGTVSPYAQHDYIYEYAVVADGGKPQAQLPQPLFSPIYNDIHRIRHFLENTTSSVVQQTLSIVFGRRGVFLPTMIEPLRQRFMDDTLIPSERDEALLFLTQLKSPAIITWLMEEANRPEEEGDKYGIPSRCMFGLLAIGDIDALTAQLQHPRTEQMYITPYAYALAGMANPRGLKVLQSLAKHRDKKVRWAVDKATKDRANWKS
ncbi:MAG: NACHT domain-containing protein [Oscillochloris sp.]|nr:NACHT domain-containing protein [Oscillochloris sp.]